MHIWVLVHHHFDLQKPYHDSLTACIQVVETNKMTDPRNLLGNITQTPLFPAQPQDGML